MVRPAHRVLVPTVLAPTVLAPTVLAPTVLASALLASALLASALLAGCSGDEPAAATSGRDSTPSDLAASVPLAPASTGVSSSSPAGGSLAPGEFDPCLVGRWSVSLETVELLIAAAFVPVPDLAVPTGGFTVTLADDGSVAGTADFTAAFSLGTSPAEADIEWRATGTWSALDGTVALALTEQEGGLTELRVDGAAQAGSALDARLPLAGGTYTCTTDRLEVTADAGGAGLPLVFER